MIGIEFAHLISGVAIVEIVFNVPGMGRGLLDAINHRDYVLVQSIVVIIALVVLLTNLVVDLIAASVNPAGRAP
jgi:peptide/nickel transport system permease protein